ncbi:MAG: hypothetical protein P8Q92_13220 [Pseudoprimorskyibacter sp.]|nr:hypothetical protein [Pseudoprimorskyibacter sp.]
MDFLHDELAVDRKFQNSMCWIDLLPAAGDHGGRVFAYCARYTQSETDPRVAGRTTDRLR